LGADFPLDLFLEAFKFSGFMTLQYLIKGVDRAAEAGKTTSAGGFEIVCLQADLLSV